MNFFTVIKKFFVQQKILLRTTYMQKVRGPTFLRPKFNDRRLLCKWKNSEFEVDVTPSIYNFFQFFFFYPHITNLPKDYTVNRLNIIIGLVVIDR